MLRSLPIILVVSISSFATWSNPQLLGSPITDYTCSCPTISADYSFMIFSSNRPGSLGGSTDLFLSQRVGGVWQAPIDLGGCVNTATGETAPFLTHDGTKLYFSALNPKDMEDSDIYVSEMDGMTAGQRVIISPPIYTSSTETSPVLTQDGNTMYFARGKDDLDIYVSTKNGGVWSEPQNLGDVVNSSSIDRPCWISADGLTLVFYSSRSGGMGSGDIWMTTKSGGVWGSPINFGAPINSTSSEIYITFVCNDGVVGGMVYLTRSISYNSYIYTSVDSGYINISPASVGELKALYR
jgi:Tol biopolymer transport system component